MRWCWGYAFMFMCSIPDQIEAISGKQGVHGSKTMNTRGRMMATMPACTERPSPVQLRN